MILIKARNVNDAYDSGLWWLQREGRTEDSRNGKVKAMPYPVITEYCNPWERVLIDSERDANPFFHLSECLWILAGAKDLAWPAKFASQMREYSDDGVTLNAAYGYRLRRYFGIDQLGHAIRRLRLNPNDRRVVLSMWDPKMDVGSNSRDLPCNTHIYLRVCDGALQMTVCCRSNDVIWGAYGANAVHFSFLHEVLAWALKLKMGTLWQVSNNFHIYERHWPLMNRPLMNRENPYRDVMTYIPLNDGITGWEYFVEDCENIVQDGSIATPRNQFLRKVYMPMLNAWEGRKTEAAYLVPSVIARMPDCDWKMACQQWLARRVK